MDGEFTAFWSKGEWDGGCSNCKGKPEKVAVIKFADEVIRFCPDCLDSLWAISDSLLDEHNQQ